MSIINTLIKPVDISTARLSQSHTEEYAHGTDMQVLHAPADTPKHFDLRSYFASKGFTLDTDRQNVCIAPVENLAFLIAANYRDTKNFITYLRDNIGKKNFYLNYSLGEASDAERRAVVALSDKFCDYGIISNVFYNKNTNMVNGKISSAPRIINFLNGDYLEFYGRAVAERVVRQAALKYGVEYEIYSNAIICKEGNSRELDMVFRVGDEVFWSEVKSGKFSDFDAYRRLGLLMGVNPDKHILLVAEKSTEEAETISWLYEFYVTNIETYETKLAEMIDKAFKGGKNND